jgi:hypothetical protein
VDFPGIAEPMLLVRFPDGGSLSIEFTDQAPDDDSPRLGAWLELRAEDHPPSCALPSTQDCPKSSTPATPTTSWGPEAGCSLSRH